VENAAQRPPPQPLALPQRQPLPLPPPPPPQEEEDPEQQQRTWQDVEPPAQAAGNVAVEVAQLRTELAGVRTMLHQVLQALQQQQQQ
jgi:hypothetical protein